MILGINPFFDDYYCFHDYKYQPIGILSVLSTLRSAGYDVAFLDADHKTKSLVNEVNTKRRQQTRKPKELENTNGGYYRYGLGDKAFQLQLMKYVEPEVILMTSSMTFRWHSVRDCIALTKEVFPNVPVVLGGIYATLAYEHAKEHSGADFVIQGPGEAKALALVNELTGNQKRMPKPLPFWAFNLLPCEKRGFAMLLTSYGCTRNCAHCASRLLYGGYKMRDTGEVIEEIDDRYNRHGVKEFHLYDDDLLEDSPNHFELWAKEVIRRFPKARFHVPNALLIDQLTLRNAELLRELKVKPIVLGVDAVKEAELLGRWWISFKAIKDTVDLLEKAGFKRYDIKIYVHVSHPTQTLRSLLETIRFLLELGVRPTLNRFTPIPGTKLFDQENTDLALLNNKIYAGMISRKDFGKPKAFIDAIHYLQKGGLDLINGTDEFTEAARSILITKLKEYLTTTQVAQYLGVDASTVRRHVKQGKLIPAKQVGNRAYFDKSQIEKELPF